MKWIVEGQVDGDVIDAIHQLWPELDAANLYDRAVDQVASAATTDRSVILGWCLMARRELYRKMFEIGDFAGALRATEKIESLAEKLG